VPKENDSERLGLLLRILRDPASNVVLFKRRAFVGSDEPDDIGLDRLLPDLPRMGQRAELREALVEFLESGGRPNRLEYTYEDRDPETIYEFRFELQGVRVYVKTELKDAESHDPTLEVKSVKRQN
jgi:hypothetical protein